MSDDSYFMKKFFIKISRNSSAGKRALPMRYAALLFLVSAGLALCIVMSGRVDTGQFVFTFAKQKAQSKSENVYRESKASVLFLGDLMFDRYIRQTSEKKGDDYVLADVKELLSSSDLAVGNLEGPITENESVSVNTEVGSRANYIFTFEPKFAKMLSSANIRLVNLGNNHILNFGKDGAESTKKYLLQNGVKYFGDPLEENGNAVIETIRGVKIAFVSYNRFLAGGKQKAFEDIAKADDIEANFVVLYAHWGSEYSDEPDSLTKKLAHEFVDAGVDLIIGSHPHVIQSKEEYKNKMIYYSLGNFVFDQYFDDRTRKGMAVLAEVSPDGGVQFKEYYVKMEKSGQTVMGGK